MASQPDTEAIARLSLHDPTHFAIQKSQTVHRLALLQQWKIATGTTVLEVGCGQGDCTTILATAVGAHGKVVALDPAALDYGQCFCSLISQLCVVSSAVDMSLANRRTVHSGPGTESHIGRAIGKSNHLGAGVSADPSLITSHCRSRQVHVVR